MNTYYISYYNNLLFEVTASAPQAKVWFYPIKLIDGKLKSYDTSMGKWYDLTPVILDKPKDLTLYKAVQKFKYIDMNILKQQAVLITEEDLIKKLGKI